VGARLEGVVVTPRALNHLAVMDVLRSDSGLNEIESILIDGVVEWVRERLAADEATQCEAFVRQYYRWVPAEDLASRGSLDLYGAALAQWSFAQQRAHGEAKIRLYNPHFEQHGWQSRHTVIEIVSDDMPFLVNSITMELSRQGYGIHLMIHPVLCLRRNGDGQLIEVLAPGARTREETLESVMHIEVDRETETDRLLALRASLAHVISQVRAAVEDWPQMRQRLHEIAASLAQTAPTIEPAELGESQAFLEWLDDSHFTFLGYRDYELVRDDSSYALRSVEGSGLGILRDNASGAIGARRSALSVKARAIALSPRLLVLTKANSRATVHHPSYLDYVGVKRFDSDGQVVGERRFLGLYTALAYKQLAEQVPILRGKVAYVLRRAGFAPDSHDRKALLKILEIYPRDELLQISEDALFEIAMGILAIRERQRVRLFVRRDDFERFVSCLVFVPRDRFNTENRERIAAVLCEAFAASVRDWSLLLSESALVRIHYVLGTEPGHTPLLEPVRVEQRLVEVTRTWTDDLHHALIDELDEPRGTGLYRRYADAFPAAYRADWVARSAVADIERAEETASRGGLGMSLYQPLEAQAGVLRCKLFSADAPISLSDVLPIFENMGVRITDERPYEISRRGSPPLWIYDFGFVLQRAGDFDADQVLDVFREAFIGIWHGVYENDSLNRLVLEARLRGREVTILRAVTKYLRQAGTSLSDGYLQRALTTHPDIAELLVALFRARFDPREGDRDSGEAERLGARIERTIDAVESLDEDRILRDCLAVVRAMTRTDYFQPGGDGAPKPSLAFKLDPSQLPLLPHPRPRFEVFVYSPRTEGVHLRGGKVARGGLRWSNRREDFRTEVLGLMKAQTVKNAVIVPVGAKGGFVVKQAPHAGGLDALREEVVACYRIFVGGLLDITDNIVEGELVAPAEVVRYDDDDPYLVVAADKGTAAFSDIANGIAAAHKFWLGDAFASGGSVGYDHKKMGITARGAWESIKRHFRELGRDIQTSDFTVVGIGDMSGDVFGNGMLLSPHIKLVGAFNHEHVFLDPDPDPAASHAERQRLFELPDSAWSDYDPTLISVGGGVHLRTAKSIPCSPQVRVLLQIEEVSLAPDELIRALLRAPVDLLWNGGIGTYVKASSETDVDAGDKADDAVRINGIDLRCRVVGEGGNLGLTQRGRIEYAAAGGRVNTDAIDNVGGVNCSDREVNIKILLDALVSAGELTAKQRNELLAEMTDDVAELVLRDSYTQTQALSLAASQAPQMLDMHGRLIRNLEHVGGLERAIEFLPDDEEIAERRLRDEGLTSPELAVLLAYTKTAMHAALLESDLPEDPHLETELEAYFPSPLPQRFAAQLRRHRLRREIIATHVTNDFVDRAGVSAAFRLDEETGATPAHVARAYIVAREAFELRRFSEQVEALDNIADAQTQIAMLLEGRKLVERASGWLVRNRMRPIDIVATIELFAPGAAALAQALPDVLEGDDRRAYDELAARFAHGNVPPALASRAAGMGPMLSALDIVEVVRASGRATADVAAAHFRLGSRFALHWLRDRMIELPRSSRWEVLARAALREDLSGLQRALTAEVLRASPDTQDVDRAIEAWAAANAPTVERCARMLADIRTSRTYDITTLSVALREARNLIHPPA
jgi:glutamate dehydrogenase